MNDNALKLGMRDSQFSNPHGLASKVFDSIYIKANKSTAMDLCKLSQAYFKCPILSKICDTKHFSCRNYTWHNTNQLLNYENYHGLKTGLTPTAGACLSVVYKSNVGYLFLVLIGAKDQQRRFDETDRIINWHEIQRMSNISNKKQKLHYSMIIMIILKFFLLIAPICCSYLESLEQSEFGKSLQQTILIYMQMDDSQLSQILTDMEQSFHVDQQSDDQAHDKQVQICDEQLSILNQDIEQIKYKITDYTQQIIDITDQVETQVIKQKSRELEYDQQNLKESEQSRNDQLLNLQTQQKEADELLEVIRDIRFQYDKKVKPQIGSQQNIKFLSELDNSIKDSIRQINKLIQKKKYHFMAQLLFKSSSQFDETKVDNFILLLTEMIKLLEQNKDDLRIQIEQTQQFYDIYIQQLKSNIQELENEIEGLKSEYLLQKTKKENLQYENQNLEQSLEQKSKLKDIKYQQCQSQDSDYQQQRQERDEQRNLLSQLIELVVRDIQGIKDFYIIKGMLNL
ncbi:hypothetical protein pb186bvf_003553 [Paramecium bursaria]